MNLLENHSLKKLNTFGVECYAKAFVEANTKSDIQNLLSSKNIASQPILILGGGSNILFTKDFDGLVIKNNISGMELIKEDSEYYYVRAGAGVVWHQFVLYCIKHNYAGVENLSLIPGSVGAAPIQNIGAYGEELKDIFWELEAINILEDKNIVLSNSDCKFGYRNSIFKNEAKGKYIILTVTFKLLKKPKLNTSYGAIIQEIEKMGIKEVSVEAISKAVCNIRRSKLPDPEKIGNAGSFFKNPVISLEQFEKIKIEFPEIKSFKDSGGMKLAAGWLIEQCGWKGKQIGQAGVHKDQALVLVNYGTAKGAEIYDLSSKVLQSVKEKFGVSLEREVVIL